MTISSAPKGCHFVRTLTPLRGAERPIKFLINCVRSNKTPYFFLRTAPKWRLRSLTIPLSQPRIKSFGVHPNASHKRVSVATVMPLLPFSKRQRELRPIATNLANHGMETPLPSEVSTDKRKRRRFAPTASPIAVSSRNLSSYSSFTAVLATENNLFLFNDFRFHNWCRCGIMGHRSAMSVRL